VVPGAKLIHPSFEQELILETIDLIICPSSLGLMVLHEDTPTFIAITVVGIVLIENAILYALLAQLIWQVLRGAAATLRFLSRLHDRIGNVRFVLTLSAVLLRSLSVSSCEPSSTARLDGSKKRGWIRVAYTS